MPFIRNVPGLEAVSRDYSKKGVKFYFLYKGLRHPGTNGMVEAVTLNERLKQIEHANKELQTTIPWICDGLDGAVEKALGGAPNSEYAIDEKGVVVRKRFWLDPEELRSFLAARFGKVAKPTTVADLKREPVDPNQSQKRGLKVPEGMKLCDVSPLRKVSEKEPLYVKLVLEAGPELLKSGMGKLWFDLFVDPIYGRRWDKSAEPVRWELTCDDPSFQAVKAKGVHDEDERSSREFLLDVKAAGKEASYVLTANLLWRELSKSSGFLWFIPSPGHSVASESFNPDRLPACFRCRDICCRI
ncbi:MAG: hypothetical protein ACJAQT_002680 [Akkermansiaceae bacterium]